MQNKAGKYYLVKSLEKGMRVIELLAEHGGLTVTQLAKLLNTDTSASHRFLSTLRELDYVEKSQDGQYQLTFKLLEQGMKVADRIEIRQIARPFMQELSDKYGQNINLAHFDGVRLVQIDQIPSRDIFRIDHGIGTEIAVHATGLGKAIAAFMPESEREDLLVKLRLDSIGPNTITDLNVLKENIRQIQKIGFAMDDEEMALGLRCVAAPIVGNVMLPAYAISISGPIFYMKEDRIEEMGSDLIRICNQISAILREPGKAAAI